MKRITVIIAAAAAGSLGAAGIANTDAERPMAPAFGALAESLVLDDVWVDAERVFAKIDVDQSGEIDVDEYAAQAVVYAGLIRFNGLLAVDGRETIHVGLPRDVEVGMGAAERSAIDAVARADYYRIAEDGPITGRRWVALRLEAFEDADANEDGQLTGNELHRFVMDLARYEPTRDRWI